MEKTDTHIELLNRFINGKTTPEEEQMLLEWLHNSDYKERIMNFYTLKWEKTSGKRLPIEVQIRIFRKIKKQIRQRKITHNCKPSVNSVLHIKLKPWEQGFFKMSVKSWFSMMSMMSMFSKMSKMSENTCCSELVRQ